MKKIIALFSLVSLLILGTRPAVSHALTREEIMAQIQLLLQQVAYLQAEIQRLNNGNTGGCLSINSTLSLGSSGYEVESLQTILTREGFYIPSNETSYKYFGSGTHSAVISFQEKYRYETLSPSGLFFGTGVVGPYTRAKLNQIGCGTGTGTSYGSLLVLFPNGGEVWQAGESKKIWWEYRNNNDYSYAGSKVELWKGSQVVATVYSSGVSTDLPIPSNAPSGSDYKIKVSSVSNPNIYDWSDSYLSVYGGSYGNPVGLFAYPVGGEQVMAGDIMRVRWNYNYNQSYRVELYKGNQFILSVMDNGSTGADILLPSSLVQGFDYKIKVYNSTLGTTIESSNFTVLR